MVSFARAVCLLVLLQVTGCSSSPRCSWWVAAQVYNLVKFLRVVVEIGCYNLASIIIVEIRSSTLQQAPNHSRETPVMTITTTKGATAANAANGAGNGAPEAGRNHVVIFPFMAKGHTLPLLHFATALSVHHTNLRVTLITTPANRAFARSRLPASVDLVELPFPSLPPLPTGVESTDALPCLSLYPAFLRATDLLREPFAEFMASLPSPPLVLVSDFFLGFTQRVAGDASVHRIVFHGMSCFSMAVCKALIVNPPASVEPSALFHVPGMPEHVAITVEEVPNEVAKFADPDDDPVFRFLVDSIGDSDVRSWGVLVNSFAALDEDYVAPLESFYQPGARAWLVGPLFLAGAAGGGISKREDEQDPEGCLSWLDERARRLPGSVLYVSFGTQAHVANAQLDEIACGLVQSGHPFLWAVRSDSWTPPVELGPNGKIVRGWVPQRSVLAHMAVGGFMSHCGWNSTMESLAAGKPILACPMIAEQMLNAKHVVDIIGAGVKIDVKVGAMAMDLIERTEVQEKVRKLMDSDGEAGKRVRARAAWAQRMAKSAVGDGGTSRLALQRLVEELQRTYDGGRGKV